MYALGYILRYGLRDDRSGANVKFLKPWWDTLSDYILYGMLILIICLIAIKLNGTGLHCAPIILCAHEQSNCSDDFIYSNLEFNSVHINDICSDKVHSFMSYLPALLLISIIILYASDRFWLKFPKSEAIIARFLDLLQRCKQISATDEELYVLLVKGTQKEKELKESGNHEILELINLIPHSDEKVTLCQAISQDIKRFCERYNETKTLLIVYLFKMLIPCVLSICVVIIMMCFGIRTQGNFKCDIKKVQNPNLRYFFCSDPIITYEQMIMYCMIALCMGLLCLYIGGIISILYHFTKRHGEVNYTGDAHLIMYLLKQYENEDADRFLKFFSTTYLKDCITDKTETLRRMSSEQNNTDTLIQRGKLSRRSRTQRRKTKECTYMTILSKKEETKPYRSLSLKQDSSMDTINELDMKVLKRDHFPESWHNVPLAKAENFQC